MLYKLTSLLPSWDLTSQRVFLRADLNVPLKNGTIVNDYRLRALLPTIELIQKKGGKIILATHIGRPQGNDASLSTRHLIPWFEQHAIPVEFEDDLEKALSKSHEQHGSILLLENLRFSYGEKKYNEPFAHALSQLGDYYVNDAFGLLHRTDTSITQVPLLFSPEKRTIGLLIEKELSMLNQLVENPKKPMVLIVGGGKAHDKLPLLNFLIDKAQTILVGPALAFTFLKALGCNVGKSLVDETALEECKKLIMKAQKIGTSLILPSDFIVAHTTFDGQLFPHPISLNDFPHDGVGISIGPETTKLFAQEIVRAGTVFLNGLMGSVQRPETLHGMDGMLQAMAQSQGFTVIAGGDSVAATELLGYADKIDYLSTGGGATLTYLSGQKLPGLDAFIR